MATRVGIGIVWEAVRIMIGVALTLPFAAIGFTVALIEDGYALGKMLYTTTLKWWEE